MGDAGICFYGDKSDKYIQKWHESKPYTTFAVRGNHDSTTIIKSLPLVQKFGGLAYEVSPHVYYAKSGEIYNICGYKCLVINGAVSMDAARRREGYDWWADEGISKEDLDNAYKNLEKVDFKVDFIFSHTGGSYNSRMINLSFEPTEADKMLDYILRDVEFNRFYYGHYHQDKWTSDNSHCLYNCVYEIIDGKEQMQHGINYYKGI